MSFNLSFSAPTVWSHANISLLTFVSQLFSMWWHQEINLSMWSPFYICLLFRLRVMPFLMFSPVKAIVMDPHHACHCVVKAVVRLSREEWVGLNWILMYAWGHRTSLWGISGMFCSLSALSLLIMFIFEYTLWTDHVATLKKILNFIYLLDLLFVLFVTLFLILILLICYLCLFFAWKLSQWHSPYLNPVTLPAPNSWIHTGTTNQSCLIL